MGILEESAAQIVTKVRGGTTKNCHLCPSCDHVITRRGVNGSEDAQICSFISHYDKKAGRITGSISECSAYHPKNLPSIRDLRHIAWDLTIDHAKNKIGFVSPEERKKERGNREEDW